MALDKTFLLQLVKGFRGGVLGDVEGASGFSDGHRDLAVVEAVVALGELDIERASLSSQGASGRTFEHPVIQLQEPLVSAASTCVVVPSPALEPLELLFHCQ